MKKIIPMMLLVVGVTATLPAYAWKKTIYQHNAVCCEIWGNATGAYKMQGKCCGIAAASGQSLEAIDRQAIEVSEASATARSTAKPTGRLAGLTKSADKPKMLCEAEQGVWAGADGNGSCTSK